MKRIDIDSSGFERVVSVEHVIRLAAERRACYHTWHDRIYPAAALANWQAKVLHDSINDGRILIYPKPGKAKQCITKN